MRGQPASAHERTTATSSGKSTGNPPNSSRPASAAASLLFRDLAVDFPLNVSVVASYAEAGKGSVPVAAERLD